MVELVEILGRRVGIVIKSRVSSNRKTVGVSSFGREETQSFDGSRMMVGRVGRRWARVRDVLGSL